MDQMDIFQGPFQGQQKSDRPHLGQAQSWQMITQPEDIISQVMVQRMTFEAVG